MQDTKFWLDSTTVRGALVTTLPAAALFLKAFDVNLGEGEQRNILEGIVALVGLIGTAYAIIGRFRASKWITTSKE